MTDKSEYVESAVGRALHKTKFDLNKAYRLAIEFYKDVSGIEPGDVMIQRIYSEVDLQFKNKNVIVPVKKQIDEAKVDSYLRSKGK